jgi:hypothetical protein
VIITHESDLDGLIAGVLLQRLARKMFQSDIRLEAHHYNYWKQRELREKSAWVTDLAFEPRMDRANWAVIDHHATDVPNTRCSSTISTSPPRSSVTSFASSRGSDRRRWTGWCI